MSEKCGKLSKIILIIKSIKSVNWPSFTEEFDTSSPHRHCPESALDVPDGQRQDGIPGQVAKLDRQLQPLIPAAEHNIYIMI